MKFAAFGISLWVEFLQTRAVELLVFSELLLLGQDYGKHPSSSAKKMPENNIFPDLLIKGHDPPVLCFHSLHYDISTSGILKAHTFPNNIFSVQVLTLVLIFPFDKIYDILQVCYWKLDRNFDNVRPVFQTVQSRFCKKSYFLVYSDFNITVRWHLLKRHFYSNDS